MNKNSVQKRILSLVLALIMLVGLMPDVPMPAAAASPSEGTKGVAEKVAESGGEWDAKVRIVGNDCLIYSVKSYADERGPRAVNAYSGQLDPDENDGVGAYAYCYDHRLGATTSQPMTVTISEDMREDDPLSLAVYYSGYTDEYRVSREYLKGLVDVLKAVYTAYNWPMPEFITSGWEDIIQEDEWRKATQFAIWSSQKYTDENGVTKRMMWFQDEQEFTSPYDGGPPVGSWKPADAEDGFYDYIYVGGDTASGEANAKIDRVDIIIDAADCLYLYATYMVNVLGIDYSERVRGKEFTLFEEDTLTGVSGVTYDSNTKTLDFSGIKSDGSGTLADAYKALNGAGGEVVGIRDNGDDYAIYMVFTSYSQTGGGISVEIDRENSVNAPQDAVWLGELDNNDIALFPELQAAVAYADNTGLPSGGSVAVPAGVGFIKNAPNVYPSANKLSTENLAFPCYRKLCINKAWVDQCAEAGTEVEIKIKASYNKMTTFDMYVGNNSKDYYQPFVVGGNWVNDEDVVTVKWGGKSTNDASFKIHKVKVENGVTSDFAGVSFTATCADYPGVTLNATTDSSGIATFIVPGDKVQNSAGNYTTWTVTESVPSGYTSDYTSCTVTLTKSGDNGIARTIKNTKTIIIEDGDGDIYKTDLNGNPIGPAEFRIQGHTTSYTADDLPDNPGIADSEPVDIPVWSDASGKLLLDWGQGNGGTKISPGVYWVTEETAPNGYEVSDEKQFLRLDVKNFKEPMYDDEGEFIGYNVWQEYTSSGPITFKNAPKQSVLLKKVDASGKGLAGAVFELYYNGTLIKSDIMTGADGTFLYAGPDGTGVESGTYRFVETKAPDGYFLPANKITQEIVVDNHNPVVENPIPVTFTNYTEGDIVIYKVDADNTNKKLEGAVMDIMIDGYSLGYRTTGADGSIVITHDEYKEYLSNPSDEKDSWTVMVREIKAPSGYFIDDIHWQMRELKVGQTDALTFTFTDTKYPEILIEKRDSQTGAKLPGARFQVTIDGMDMGVFVTDDNGKIRITYDDLRHFLADSAIDAYKWTKVQHTVTVTELDPPGGYLRDDTPQTQTLNIGQSVLPFTFDDTKYPEIVIRKEDAETYKRLPGAVFTVSIDGIPLDGTFETDANGEIWITYDKMGQFLRENAIEAAEWSATPHTVTVTEVSAPKGYNRDKVKDSASGYTQTRQLVVGDSPLSFTFYDTSYRKLRITKTDSQTDWPLAGATYELKSIKLDDEENMSYQEYRETNEEGWCLFEDIPNGTYELRETKAPLGYESNEDWFETIIVTSDSDIIMERQYTNDPKSGLFIRKTDGITGEPVKGAKFTITPMLPLTGPALERTTDEYGIIELEGLEMGTYQIVETDAPEPYIVDSTPRNVQLIDQQASVIVEIENYKKDTLYIQKVDALDDTPLAGAYFDVWNAERTWVKHLGPTESNGFVMLPGLAEGRYIVQEKTAPTGYVLDESEYDIEVISGKANVLTVGDNAYATLLARKIDSRTGKPIAGAVFKLETADHSLIGTLESDANGEALFTNLLAGHYIITEVQAPPGHQISDPSEQVITIKYGVNNYVDFVDAEKGSLVIILQDKHTGEYLPGGQFIVTREDDQVVVYDGPTDITGTIVVGDLLHGWYTVEQYFAPDGYTIVDKSTKVEILVGEQQTVYFLDETAGIVIEKYDATNPSLMLEGARFQLVRDEDNVVIGEYVTGKDGMAMASGLTPGLYHVKELVAPEGYVIDEEPKLVHVKGGTTAHVAFSDTPLAGITISVVDKNTRQPLTGCIVEVWRQNGELVNSYTTDVTGTVQTDKLDAGYYVLKLVHVINGYTATETEVTVEVKEGVPVTHTFECVSDGILRVESVTTEGRVAGLKFRVTGIDGSLIGEYTTNADGMYTLPSLEPGWYRIIPISAPDGYTLQDIAEKTLEVTAGGLTTARFVLQQNASVRVKIVDGSTGNGIYGVRLLVKNEDATIREYTTDNQGYIYLEREVLKGNYTLEMISAPDGYHVDTVVKSIKALAGETTEISWAIYKEAGQIQVVVTSADYNATLDKAAGSTLQGAVFEIVNADTYQVAGTMISDASGIAASSGLPIGRYLVRMTTAPAYYACSAQQTEVRLKVNNDVVRVYDTVKSVNLKTVVSMKTNNSVRAGSNMRVDILQANNASDVRLDNFNLHIKLPTDAARVNSVAFGTWNASVWYSVSYKTNMSDYKVLASNLNTSNKYAYDLSATALGLQSGEYVTDIRLECGAVPAGFAMTSKSAMSLYVLSTVYNGHRFTTYMETSGQYNTTTVSTTGIDNNWPYSASGVYVSADGSSYGGSGTAGLAGNSGQWATATATWATTVLNSAAKMPGTLPKTGF